MSTASNTVSASVSQQCLSSRDCDLLLAYMYMYSKEKKPVADANANWPVIIEAAKHHRVLPLLAARMNGTPLPEETRKKMQESLETVRERIARAYRSFTTIADEARRRNLSVIFFKGPILAEQFFGPQCLRPFSDLDFIVPDEDLEKTEQMLVDLGYRMSKLRNSDMRWMTGSRPTGVDSEYLPSDEVRRLYLEYHFHLPYVPKDPQMGVGIDLHWTLFRKSHMIFPVEELWQRAKPVTVAEREVLTFSAPDTLLYLTLHLSLDGYPRVRLMKLLDIVLMGDRLTESEWEEFVQRAKAYGVEELAYLGVWLSYRAFGQAVPKPVEQLRKPSLRRTMLSLALTKTSLLRCNSPAAEAAWDWVLGQPGPFLMNKMLRATVKQCLYRSQ